MKTTYVKDLETNQIVADEPFLVCACERAEDKNGKAYFKLTLGDISGKVEAKIWSDKLEAIEPKILKTGNILKVSGKVSEYKGIKQMTILAASRVDDFKLSEFLESSMFDAEEMFKELLLVVEAIRNNGIRKVLKRILDDKDIASRLKYWPASKAIHHDFRSGLLQHIMEMITVAKGLDRFYPDANFDILIAGIILHDIGKLYELDGKDLSTPYTKAGTLLGHIFIGTRLFEKFAENDLPEDIKLHIMHLILSHHGKHEFGSPVLPATVEALMLHHIDNVSAKPRTADSFIKQSAGSDGFTSRNLWLENARLWNFKMPPDELTDATENSYNIEEHESDQEQDSDQIPLV